MAWVTNTKSSPNQIDKLQGCETRNVHTSPTRALPQKKGAEPIMSIGDACLHFLNQLLAIEKNKDEPRNHVASAGHQV